MAGRNPGSPPCPDAPPPGPPFPDRRSIAPSTTSPACSSPRRSLPSRRPSIESKSGRRQRSWSTRRSSTTPHVRGDRAQRAGADRPVGRRPQRVRRRPCDLLRLRARSFEHGQVQLYAGPGFAATFLTNSERHEIFENDMLPHLRADDWDAAILAAMGRIDDAASPENAARLERGRQLNAAIGLIGAPLDPRGAGWLGFLPLAAVRQGPGLPRPSPSILRPGPAAGPHGGRRAMVMDGDVVTPRPDHRDARLASRGLIGVPREERDPGLRPEGRHRPRPRGRRQGSRGPAARNSRRPMEPGRAARAAPAAADRDRATTSNPTNCSSSGRPVDDVDAALEKHVVGQGWFAEAPSKAVSRWVGRGVLAIVGGAGCCFWPSRSR